MNGLEYQRDVRSTEPDTTGHRRGRFQAGWDDANAEGKDYGEAALEDLTWQNLGFRLGKLLGKASPHIVEEMYHLCVRHQRETPDATR